MRFLTVIFFLFLGSQLLIAQSAEDEVIRLRQSMGAEAFHSDQERAEEASPEKDELKGHWNMSVGTSFSYMKGYGSGMGFYAAPMYTLPLNKRWSLHGGLLASNFSGLSSPMPGSEFQSSKRFNSLAVYAAASYKMTDKLILHGSGLKNLASYPITPLAPGLMDNVTMGATYKLGNNISIGASIHINQGHGYYQMPYSSPFGW